MIWLIEAAKQREAERVQSKLDKLHKKWGKKLREKQQEEEVSIELHKTIQNELCFELKVRDLPYMAPYMIPQIRSRLFDELR